MWTKLKTCIKQKLSSIRQKVSPRQPESTTIDLRAIPFRQVAILDVSQAPIVSIYDNAGALLNQSNICTTPFKSTLANWSANYSLVYPDAEEWTAFWNVYKDIL
jgi:hypothetical protein